jgi:tetratricopeptide (TPR) repeat protein
VTEDYRVRHQLARSEEVTGKTQAALANYQRALEDCPDAEENNVLREKAAIIHNSAILMATQGKVNEAIALYEQSLEIQRAIDNQQGIAATLHQMAGIYANQGKVNEAIALYEQSLEIQRAIDNQQGIAATLAMSAQLLAAQGEFGLAISHLQESIRILQSMGSWEVSKVEEILANIQQMQAQGNPANPSSPPQKRNFLQRLLGR